MKKTLLIIFALFLGFGASAQTFGLRFGYNMSGLRIDNTFADYLDANSIEGKMTNGVNIGLIFEKAIKPNFDGHAELNFTQKGSAYDMYANEANHGTSGHGQTNLNYMELGLMAKIKFGPAYIGLGPFFDYLVSAQEINYKQNDDMVNFIASNDPPNGTGGDIAAAEAIVAGNLGVSSLKNDEFFDMNKDEMNRFDFGGHLSIGAQFPVGPVKVFGEARGNMSFINWEENPGFSEAGFEYKRNLAITFSVGVLFNKPSK
ncbi:MAG: outer membrane beta-barrel protein [Bacteroidales bacterium]|nr:outer membrane beta-barrel protein [Bacteroidales bacterium]